MEKCFSFIVFYIEHVGVQLILINVYSHDGLRVSFENKIQFFLRRIVLNAKYYFAEELRVSFFCFFLNVCIGMLLNKYVGNIREEAKKKKLQIYYKEILLTRQCRVQ